MGCGMSKQIEKRLKDQDEQILQLIETNFKLQKEIKEIEEIRQKRKQVYLINEEEVTDLRPFKFSLEKKFQKFERQVNQMNVELRVIADEQQKKARPKAEKFQLNSIKDEDQWRKMVENDNDLTIKPLYENALDDIKIEIEAQQQEAQNIEILVNLDLEQPKQPQAKSNSISNLDQQNEKVERVSQKKETSQGQRQVIESSEKLEKKSESKELAIQKTGKVQKKRVGNQSNFKKAPTFQEAQQKRTIKPQSQKTVKL